MLNFRWHAGKQHGSPPTHLLFVTLGPLKHGTTATTGIGTYTDVQTLEDPRYSYLWSAPRRWPRIRPPFRLRSTSQPQSLQGARDCQKGSVTAPVWLDGQAGDVSGQASDSGHQLLS